MEAGRRERKKTATKNAIVDVAMALFEAEGYDGVTMERIAERADVAKATLYRYFPVKEAILAAFMRRSSEARRPDLEALIRDVPCTRDRLITLFTGIARWFSDHAVYVDRYITYRLSSRLGFEAKDSERSGLHLHLITLLEAGQRQGDVRTDIPAETLAMSLQVLHLGSVLSWLRHPGADLAASAAPMISLFLDGAAGARP